MGTLRFWHGSPLHSIAFAPDGKSFATDSGHYAGSVPVFDGETGRLLRTLAVPPGPLDDAESWADQVAFAPDGKSLAASCNGNTIRVWELATGRAICTVTETASDFSITRLTFAPNGKRLASIDGSGTSIWDHRTGVRVRRFEWSDSFGPSVSFSPDGTVLAAGQKEGEIAIWDVASGRKIRQFPGQGPTACVGFAHDGKTVRSRALDGILKTWDLTTGEEIGRVRIEDLQSCGDPVVSPNGKMIAGAFPDATIRLWDAATGKQGHRIQLELGEIAYLIAFSPDGTTIACSSGNATDLDLWDIRTGKRKFPYSRHRGAVSSVAFLADDKIIASISGDGGDSTIRFWDVATSRELRRILDGPPEIWDVSVGDDARSLLRVQRGPTGDIGFSRDGGRLISTARDGTLWFWDTGAGKRAGQITLKGGGPIGSVALAPDAQKIAASDGNDALRVWSIVTGEELSRNAAHHGAIIHALAFSPDARRIASGGMDGSAKLWDTATLRLIGQFTEPRESVECLAFSPDGQTVGVGGEDTVWRLWKPGHGQIQRSPARGIDVDSQIIYAVAFSPSGDQVAWSGDKGVIKFWDLKKGRGAGRFLGQKGGITHVAFSRDSRLLASAGMDGTILVWDVSQLPD